MCLFTYRKREILSEYISFAYTNNIGMQINVDLRKPELSSFKMKREAY